MRKTFACLTALSLCIVFPVMIFADSTAVADTATADVSKTDSSPNTVSGYLDGSYNYLERSRLFTSATENRVFDLALNDFTLQQAAVTLSHQPSQGFGALLNVIAGRDAVKIAPYGFDPISQFNTNKIAVDLTQAFAQYTTGRLTVIAGKFVTLSGAEVINPTADSNFSRSILFGYAIPFTHTGVRTTFAVNDQWTLIAGLNNGWDNIRDFDKPLTWEFGIGYKPNETFALAAQSYTGGERAAANTARGVTGTRTLFDLVGTVNVTKKLSLIANYDYAWQTIATLPTGVNANATWQGIAGYLNYQFSEQWRTSLRGEYFDDDNGYRTGVIQQWKEATATVGYLPSKSLELRAEIRRDFSDVRSFVDSNGVTVSDNQQSYAVEVLYKFA